MVKTVEGLHDSFSLAAAFLMVLYQFSFLWVYQELEYLILTGFIPVFNHHLFEIVSSSQMSFIYIHTNFI